MRRPSSPAPRPRAFPLLPLAAGFLILLGLAQLVAWGWQSWRGIAPAEAARVGNPFGAIVDVQRRHAAARTVAERQPQRVELPTVAPLVTLGQRDSSVVLTVLLDFSLAAQRKQVREWLKPLSQELRVDVYYLPAEPNAMAPGLVLALAKQNGKMPALWRQLQGSVVDEDITRLLERTAELGVPLETLRAGLSANPPRDLNQLEPVLRWAAQHGLQSPLVLVDGFVVQAPVMRPELLKTYSQRRQTGEAIVQPEDYI